MFELFNFLNLKSILINQNFKGHEYVLLMLLSLVQTLQQFEQDERERCHHHQLLRHRASQPHLLRHGISIN